MAKIEWNQVKMSDIQRNILSVGKEGVSAADALDARSAAYQAGKSYVGRKNELFQPEAWREGENSQGFREKGGSAITSSEMRHAIRMGRTRPSISSAALKFDIISPIEVP